MQRGTGKWTPWGFALAAMLLVAPFSSFAQHEHEHEAADAGLLVLDHGAKWATDAPLRSGMEQIRNLIARTAGDGCSRRCPESRECASARGGGPSAG